MRKGYDVLSGWLRPEMHVSVRLQQHHAIRLLDQENQHIRGFAAQMQVHDALIGEQQILVPIDASPIVGFRDAIAALDAFDDVVKLRAKVLDLADPCEVLELDYVNGFGLGLDPP